MAEMAPCSSKLELKVKPVELSPRGYQVECLSKAREGNIIVCLETGCGKTLIAAMLLKELSGKFSSSQPCIAVFLVPTVMLVQQQANAIEKFTDLKVGQYNGQNDSVKWNLEKWDYDVLNLEVLVMTPQILLNTLQHALIKFECIKVLVFDECHHCQKNHPYALIMQEFYFKMEISKRPKILGMTASPVIRKGKSEFQCTQDIHSLERMLDAKIVTVENRSELDLIVPSPSIHIKEYDKVFHSLDRMQSTVKIINTMKAKKTAWLLPQAVDHKGIQGQKDGPDGLGKICRDLEYCIDELGLWFARDAVSNDYISKKDSKECYDSSNKEEKDVFLKDVLEFLESTIVQGGYDELGVSTLKPDLVSNKVAALVDVLVNFRHSEQKCIVFVERVVAAKVLANFLSEVLKPLRCEHIVGSHSKGCSSSRKSMPKTLSNFRSGLVNLLVATNVAEEGLDVQDCCLVVQFDMPKTLRSFIQSRGRARVRSSHYVILKDRKSVSEEALLDTLISSESFVIKKILQGHDLLTLPKSREENNVYKVESTGAIVTSQSSIQLLHHYCSKLPSDQFCHPQPSFVYITEPYGVKCHVTLPSNACIRLVEGELCDSEVIAKKATCLKACKLLHLSEALTDYLLPQTRTIDGNVNAHSDLPNTKAETEDLQETVIPAVWNQKPTISSGQICLHAYKIDFKAKLGDREYSNFSLLLRSPLPPTVANLSETFELSQGRAVFCKFEPLKDVILDQIQVAKAEQFQSTLFSILLDHKLEPSRTKEQPLVDSAWYLLVPLKREQYLSSSQDPEIDWERIDKLKSFEDTRNELNSANITFPKVDGIALQFSNGVINLEDVPGLLVKTIHGKTLYCIIDIFADLDAESVFPGNCHKTYVDYFKTKYNHELLHRRQHLLKARFLRDAHNFLLSRSTKEGASDVSCTQRSLMEPERSIVELPPEVCSIEYSGFYDDLVNAAVILPSLMHRIESILIATQFHIFLSSQFPEGSLISVEKVLEATTTQKCLDSFSLERLELLGDSFLKYAISRNLFVAHENADEGFLSMQRMQKICNARLFTLGKKIGLSEYIQDSFFDPKHWVAPCYPSKVICNENKVWDVHGESSKGSEGKPFVKCDKRHRWLQRKTVADAIEALIGAYLEDGGEHAALAFMQFIGLDVALDTLQVVRIQSLSNANLSLIKRVDVEAIEKLLCYRFRHKGILIEAFTHASFSNHLGKCYQRLEFLGDSVLDFLITKHLYKEFKDSKPGELTDLRSTIVSNESFARIVVEKKLYLHLIENSLELSKCIGQFVSYVCTTSDCGTVTEWDGDKCPKVLGDILESLSGAILLDGGFNLSLVWEVFEPILQPLISARRVQFHPIRELLEICQQHHFPCEESLQKGDKHCQFNFTIHVKNELVHGTALSKDKKSAKRQAGLDALKKLKALGYVHPMTGRSLISEKTLRENQELKKLGVTPEQLNGREEIQSSDTSYIDFVPSKPKSEEEKRFGILRSTGEPSLTDLCPDFVLNDADRDSEPIQEGMEVRPTIDKKSGYLLTVGNLKEATQEKSESKTTPISVVDSASTKSSSEWSQCGSICHGNEQGGIWSPNSDDQQRRTTDIDSIQGTHKIECSMASGLDAQGYLRKENNGNVDLCIKTEQSSENAPGNLMEGSCLSDGQDPDFTERFNSLYLSCLGRDANLASASQAASKGRPRTDLYETCARKGWKDPTFTCSKEEGPPHDKWFTYDVILQLPRVGQLECSGDPRKTSKAAMDSAAAELLEWLDSSGYL